MPLRKAGAGLPPVDSPIASGIVARFKPASSHACAGGRKPGPEAR